MKRALFCLVVCAACGPAARDVSAQPPDVRRLRLTTDTLLISGPGAGGQARGTAIQSLSRTTLGGRAAIVQVYWHRSAASGVETVDSLWMTDPDLHPLRHMRHSSRSRVSLDYAAGRVRGYATWEGGERREVDEELPANTFDAAAIDLIARALPLESGVDAKMNFYFPGIGTIPSTARVMARDTIVTRSGLRVPARAILVTLGEEEVLVHVAESNGDLLQVTENPHTRSPTRHRR